MINSHLIMAIYHLLFYYALLFSCYCSKSLIYGATKLANHRQVVETTSLVPAPSCSSPTRGPARGYQGMQISHRYGPCSPLGQDNSPPNTRQILLQDQLRVRSMNSISEGASVSVLESTIGAGNFVVTVGFGTPTRQMTLIFDTGSEITWIQCQPCKCTSCCYDQQDPIFDPSKSSTFANYSSTNPSCHHSMTYHDESYSRGYCGQDTLILASSLVYNKFVFGCGQDNSKGFGKAAGVLAVGQGEYSLISQTASDLGKIFCYCLPAKDSSSGYLLFGMQALETCHTDNFIPLLSDPQRPNRYFVNLVAVTLGQQRWEVSSFMVPGGTIIDSGTIVTRLPAAIYAAVSTTFREMMSQYPRVQASDLMDTCYNLEGYNNVTIPNMVLHFENSNDIRLDQSAVIMMENGSSCLAFARNDDPGDLTIIGNHQHRGLNVLYDITKGEVEIGPGSC